MLGITCLSRTDAADHTLWCGRAHLRITKMRGTPIPYFNALNRVSLLMGVERKLFFILLTLATLISFSSLFRPIMLILAGILFIGGLIMGRCLARSDTHFISVYSRHLLYQKNYDPLPSLLAPILKLEKSVPHFSSRR